MKHQIQIVNLSLENVVGYAGVQSVTYLLSAAQVGAPAEVPSSEWEWAWSCRRVIVRLS